MFNNNKPDKKPFSDTWIIRFLLILVIILAFMAGYYHAILTQEKRKYTRLEDLYVRVRGELGREETQRLIDLSRSRDILE
jgi:hypothetical protein